MGILPMMLAGTFEVAVSGLVAFAPYNEKPGQTVLKVVLVDGRKEHDYGSIVVHPHIPFIAVPYGCKATLKPKVEDANGVVLEPKVEDCYPANKDWACLRLPDKKKLELEAGPGALNTSGMKATASIGAALPGAGYIDRDRLDLKESDIVLTLGRGVVKDYPGLCSFPKGPHQIADWVEIQIATDAKPLRLCTRDKECKKGMVLEIPDSHECHPAGKPSLWIKNLPKMYTHATDAETARESVPGPTGIPIVMKPDTHFRRFYDLLDDTAKEWPLPLCPGVAKIAGPPGVDVGYNQPRTETDPICPPAFFP